MHESTIFRSSSPTCIAHTIAIRLQYYGARCASLRLRVYVPYTMQYWYWQYRVKANSLYKILFHYKAVLCESIILYAPPPLSSHLQSPPSCNTNARPLRIIRLSTDPPPSYAIHQTLCMMAISCKG